ncbi:WD40-repeat-containing domain protein [Dunaliella salina]|uniref:WD40-repeat-containing domain protein n=1 Tax=Dunaliella salina TaxID=3046 RepID=A0ABQ7GRC5_DUNSA|nr:WD40-repeat-containing domain protein [Dunaliella salina]|eukprot:KAF5837154.1 WD40-repeat-containing domain protein [Dunaliella salina]
MGKRQANTPAKNAAALGSKKSKRNESSGRDEQAQVHFLEDEDERPQQRRQATEESEEEQHETAEEKRLRLAKEYLQNMQAHMEVEEEDEGARRGVTGGSDDEGDAGKDKLGEKLKKETAEVALSDDEQRAYSVSKDGSILMWDLQTMRKTRLFRPGECSKASRPAAAGNVGDASEGGGADWVRQKARSTSQLALHAVAVSSDGAFLAVGGGDKKVHVFDGRTGDFIQSFPGHRDAVTYLAFREGSHQLFSGSLNRTVKLWISHFSTCCMLLRAEMP